MRGGLKARPFFCVSQTWPRALGRALSAQALNESRLREGYAVGANKAESLWLALTIHVIEIIDEFVGAPVWTATMKSDTEKPLKID
jgi:hypothetical protein